MDRLKLRNLTDDILDKYEEFDDAIRELMHAIDEEDSEELSSIYADLQDLIELYMRDRMDFGIEALVTDVDNYITNDKDI